MPEPVGQAEITPGFNLPALWVLHTVGPQVRGVLTSRHCEQLAACYTACLQKAAAWSAENAGLLLHLDGRISFSFPDCRADCDPHGPDVFKEK